MRGRFNYLDARYLDDVAIAKARNPYYTDYPAGVANEHIERPVLYGLADFALYVLAIYPLALVNQGFFFLWLATIPFAFLSAVMPVGPISAYYWRRQRLVDPVKPDKSIDEIITSLSARRHWLQGLAAESVKLETELSRDLELAGELRFAFETQIQQARETRSVIGTEIAKIDAQLASLDLIR